MKNNAVTPVVLGLLALAPRALSGYDIKAVVDRSTRFFWAASYGQIYPELRRLEREGLIQGEDEPRGERGRRVYKLTKAGRKALDQGPSAAIFKGAPLGAVAGLKVSLPAAELVRLLSFRPTPSRAS